MDGTCMLIAMRGYVLAIGVVTADGCRAKDTCKDQFGYVLFKRFSLIRYAYHCYGCSSFNLCDVSHIFNFPDVFGILYQYLPVAFLTAIYTADDALLLQFASMLQHVGFGCLYDNSNLRNSDLRVVAHQVNNLSCSFSEFLSYSFSYRLSCTF